MHGRGTAKGFEEFPRQEGRGDAEGHVLSPGFLEIKADALGNAERGVGEEGKADAAQKLVVDEGSALKDEVDEARLRAEAQMMGEAGQEVRQILVDKAQSGDAHGYEEQRLAKLEGGDQQQPLVVVAPLAG